MKRNITILNLTFQKHINKFTKKSIKIHTRRTYKMETAKFNVLMSMFISLSIYSTVTGKKMVLI